jgi:hypothetical protein
VGIIANLIGTSELSKSADMRIGVFYIKEREMQVSQMNQYSMQYKSMSLSVSSQSKTEEGALKESFSLNVRYMEFTFQSSELSMKNTDAQSALFEMVHNHEDIKDFLSGIEKEGMLSLKDLGYEGKSILDLTPSEAGALISDGGFFSVENTAARGAGFVISGAGDDLDMLKAGREGIIKGFEEAEKLWGGKLPDIAYETQKRTLEMIDEKIQSLGANALDVAA